MWNRWGSCGNRNPTPNVSALLFSQQVGPASSRLQTHLVVKVHPRWSCRLQLGCVMSLITGTLGLGMVWLRCHRRLWVPSMASTSSPTFGNVTELRNLGQNESAILAFHFYVCMGAVEEGEMLKWQRRLNILVQMSVQHAVLTSLVICGGGGHRRNCQFLLCILLCCLNWFTIHMHCFCNNKKEDMFET